jgi:hypothetical protein
MSMVSRMCLKVLHWLRETVRRFFLILLFLGGAASCHAAETLYSFRLRSVLLHEYVYLVLSDIYTGSFVLDNDLLVSPEKVTVDLVEVPRASVLDNLRHVLNDRRFRLVESDGVFYITKIKAESEDREFFVYHPKYRSADYLRELAGTVIGRDGFSLERPVSAGDDGIAADSDKGVQGINTLVSRRNHDALVYEGTFHQVGRLKKLLHQLDIPASEVLVKAVVYEVRKESRDGSAVNLALGLLRSVNGAGIAFNTGGDVTNGIRIQAPNFQAVWSALSSDTHFRLVSSPVMRVRSGDTARFMAGQDVPTLGSVTYQGEKPVQSVEYRSSGVIFELQPEITQEAVSLDVRQQISSFVRTETGVNDSPTLIKRELSTVVTVQDDEIIILGGLEEEQTEESRDGLFFLPDWLKGNRRDTGNTEIILLLHVRRI